MSLVATCHCGSVRLTLAAGPAEVTDCNCSICRRYGVLWAYYPPAEVAVEAAEATDTYQWDDETIAFHRCRRCGCVSHWSALDPSRNLTMGVNARLLPPEALDGVRVRRLDGAVTETYLD